MQHRLHSVGPENALRRQSPLHTALPSPPPLPRTHALQQLPRRWASGGCSSDSRTDAADRAARYSRGHHQHLSLTFLARRGSSRP
eukprot:1037376-Pleurochrysis_carterae.AAC.3